MIYISEARLTRAARHLTRDPYAMHRTLTFAQRIWDWMPARRARARVTSPVVAAANLDLPVDQVTAAMHGMLTRHELVADPRGGYHRGLPPQREGQGSCG